MDMLPTIGNKSWSDIKMAHYFCCKFCLAFGTYLVREDIADIRNDFYLKILENKNEGKVRTYGLAINYAIKSIKESKHSNSISPFILNMYKKYYLNRTNISYLNDIKPIKDNMCIQLIEEKVDNIRLKGKIEKSLSTLNPREVKVLRLRFGLEDGKSRTFEEVSKELNVTSERIRQIQDKALRKMRHPKRCKPLQQYYSTYII